MEYENIIGSFVDKNFKFLLQCATNILRSKKTDPNDLVAELIIYLYDHKEKIEPYLDIDMLMGFSISWMNNQARWASTNFNRKYQINIEFDESSLNDIVDSEPFGDSLEDEYIKDLKTIYTDEQIEKIVSVKNIIPTLSKTNQIIYNAYFNEGLSYDKIKDRYNFFKRDGKKIIYYKSKVSIYNLMTKLKKDIRDKL